MLSIADKKILIANYYQEIAAKKFHQHSERIHEEKIKRAESERLKTYENRMRLMDQHAEEKQLNLIAREKEIEQHLSFNKKSALLNII